MWTSPYRWYRDVEGNLTNKPGKGHTPLIDHMPLADAVKFGIADTDGNVIRPKDVVAAQKTKKE